MSTPQKIIEIEDYLGIKLEANQPQHNYQNSYQLDKHGEIVSLHFYAQALTPIEIEKVLLNLDSLLDLSMAACEINDLNFLKQLRQLTRLTLTNNKIEDITPLGNLKKLEQLDLSFNGIADFTPLGELSLLNKLNIGDNLFDEINFIKNCTLITELIISSSLLKDISVLSKLPNLKKLYFHNSDLIDYSIFKTLTNLEELYSCGGNFSNIKPLSRLRNLKILYLRDNNIEDISPIIDLQNIIDLHFGENKIQDIRPIQNLTQLKSLDLNRNLISDITPLKNLNLLIRCDLNKNNIESLPAWITDFGMQIYYNNNDETRGLSRKGLDLSHNPIASPPIEIVKVGKKAIGRYFEKIKEQGIGFIYEAKLTLVGEGSAGKTSLQVRLMDPTGKLPLEDKRTRGIKIYDWEFKVTNKKANVAHIWDFGGQDVYYPVHRFFLTENSVFVLVASTRQSHHNFDYWIPTIYQFGGASPIIIVQTCHDGNRISWNDLGYYIGNQNFNIIKTNEKSYYELNLLKKNEGLSKLKKTIIDQIVNLPRYGKGVPQSWIPIRDAIAAKSKTKEIISFGIFKDICIKSDPSSFVNHEDIEDLAKFLHSIGVVLWYYADSELRNWVILQPQWAMNAVYKIIDDQIVQKQKGIIKNADFSRLWKEACYIEYHVILKKMLEVFKISFPKKHKKEDYIIPARLLSMPSNSRWVESEPFLRLEYKYDFMPKGMVNQLSAELSRFITSDEEVWNNAVNFTNEENSSKAQVEEDFYNRKISIKAKGKDARGLIMLVMNSLKDITESYKGINPEIAVPCTCAKCKNNKRPTLFYYNDLLRWSTDRENSKVTCNESSENLSIEELLYNVGLPSIIKNKNKEMNKIIKLFLASSSELQIEREQFEIFVNRENKNLVKENIFLELNIWEDFIDAMSDTRMQDEYNKAVGEADVVISLVFTKVGKYTLEEFETAFRQFKISGKPLIYTYFKDAPITTGEINKQDIVSRFEFEEKLKLLGHFPTVYKSTDELLLKFKKQLD